jgi:hypothetical protein
MAERSATGPSGPERERGNARRLTIPIIIMVVPAAPVMLIAMLIVRPWESEGGRIRAERVDCHSNRCTVANAENDTPAHGRCATAGRLSERAGVGTNSDETGVMPDSAARTIARPAPAIPRCRTA